MNDGVERQAERKRPRWVTALGIAAALILVILVVFWKVVYFEYRAIAWTGREGDVLLEPVRVFRSADDLLIEGDLRRPSGVPRTLLAACLDGEVLLDMDVKMPHLWGFVFPLRKQWVYRLPAGCRDVREVHFCSGRRVEIVLDGSALSIVQPEAGPVEEKKAKFCMPPYPTAK